MGDIKWLKSDICPRIRHPCASFCQRASGYDAVAFAPLCRRRDGATAGRGLTTANRGAQNGYSNIFASRIRYIIIRDASNRQMSSPGLFTLCARRVAKTGAAAMGGSGADLANIWMSLLAARAHHVPEPRTTANQPLATKPCSPGAPELLLYKDNASRGSANLLKLLGGNCPAVGCDARQILLHQQLLRSHKVASPALLTCNFCLYRSGLVNC